MSSSKEDVFAVVKNNIMSILSNLDPDAVKPEVSMKELGANSIDRMDVVIQSMEDLSLKIPLVEFAKVGNIGGLVDLLHSKLPQEGMSKLWYGSSGYSYC